MKGKMSLIYSLPIVMNQGNSLRSFDWTPVYATKDHPHPRHIRLSTVHCPLGRLWGRQSYTPEFPQILAVGYSDLKSIKFGRMSIV